ncbi:hypothetical protein [Solitalea canadensis]|uniref:Uncharacterized protein n=1 Tax=Solitalea canadensis (strain ATCC 29591 / DSM 3403 / JCM 21819 / LMG 8368 / NBRC 15130 / NCIMB 12057 / USAM 9D) TaxID=929556 RepID=H8KPP8_SOLCM|nr:hypothetical protein [Solitalea canadensis]AFD05946.1 hypothetical protein Solca_0831 [Solitalea canadensis DSM 3403]
MQKHSKKAANAQGAPAGIPKTVTLTVEAHPNLLSQAKLNCFVQWYTTGADAGKAMNSLLELFFQNLTNETHFPELDESEIFEMYMLYRFLYRLERQDHEELLEIVTQNNWVQ